MLALESDPDYGKSILNELKKLTGIFETLRTAEPQNSSTAGNSQLSATPTLETPAAAPPSEAVAEPVKVEPPLRILNRPLPWTVKPKA
ncbi:MAG: hypothetical protein ACR2OE_01090 [Thermomicrobiales bacterium]